MKNGPVVKSTRELALLFDSLLDLSLEHCKPRGRGGTAMLTMLP